ncbi:6-pyruvoyl trahydropterin synthase family protein [Rhodoligotrophos defluvii]|uniref:6-pyruvoyl trahydropterin synthase family protein n=1 Tax=Rhodoligotrophos defluvii TaxID=2561934 RepID=UPI0010C9E4B2|nr:6-carboxytetrahydropterin synthase [Rhodoligotrophos defluvii]
MYAVEVRDHIMIAHSLPRPLFGPAQGLHGATYVVDAAFMRSELTEDEVVLDIGRAIAMLREVLAPLNYQNLDRLPHLKGRITTTEFLCRLIFDEIVKRLNAGAFGPGSEGVERVRITLQETHLARAWYEGDVNR